MATEDDNSSWADVVREFGSYSTVGIMFPVSIALGFFVGYLLDGWAGSWPWGAVAGLVLGTAAAIRNLLQVVARGDRRQAGDDDG